MEGRERRSSSRRTATPVKMRLPALCNVRARETHVDGWLPVTPDRYLAHLRGTLDQIRADGFYKIGTRHPHAASAGASCSREAPRSSTSAPTTTSGLADDPRARRRGAGRPRPLWLRHGVGALHLRHAERAPGARGRARRVPRHRRRDPLLELLRRERRIVRDAARRKRTPSSATSSTTRASSTASGSAKRAATGTATTTWRISPRDLAGGGSRRRALQADRDRRRVLDGRHHRRPRVDLRPRRRARRARDGRRLARRRFRRRSTVAARRSSAASKAASTSSPERSARRWAARRAATRRGAAEIVELLRQRSRPYLFSNSLAPCIAAASLEVLKLLASDEGATLRRRVQANGERFRRAMTAQGFDLVPGQHPIIPVMLGRRGAGARAWPRRCSPKAST